MKIYIWYDISQLPYTAFNNPPSPVTKVPNDPNSDPYPNLSYFSLLDSYDLSDYRDVKRQKLTRKKHQSKNSTTDFIKNCYILTSKILKDSYNSKFMKFKLVKDPTLLRVFT